MAHSITTWHYHDRYFWEICDGGQAIARLMMKHRPDGQLVPEGAILLYAAAEIDPNAVCSLLLTDRRNSTDQFLAIDSLFDSLMPVGITNLDSPFTHMCVYGETVEHAAETLQTIMDAPAMLAPLHERPQ